MTERSNSKNKQVHWQMQNALNRLGIPMEICWKPDNTKSVHGELRETVLFIYDKNESEAWDTFTHELIEAKLQNVTRPYRVLVNSLIAVIEKSVYEEKEEYIEFLPKMMEIINEERRKSLVHRKNGKSEKSAS